MAAGTAETTDAAGDLLAAAVAGALVAAGAAGASACATPVATVRRVNESAWRGTRNFRDDDMAPSKLIFLSPARTGPNPSRHRKAPLSVAVLTSTTVFTDCEMKQFS